MTSNYKVFSVLQSLIAQGWMVWRCPYLHKKWKSLAFKICSVLQKKGNTNQIVLLEIFMMFVLELSYVDAKELHNI